MNLKSPKKIILLVVIVLVIGGGIALFTVRNTFVVENTATPQQDKVVYLTAQDVIPSPEELVAPEPEVSRVKILQNEVGYLNVRKGPGVSNAKLTRVKPGEEYEYIEEDKNWYKIVLSDSQTGWVSGNYVEEIED